MKCPNCHEQMEKGFLQGPKMVGFVKEKHKFSLLPKEGEVLLANHAYNNYYIDAFICKSCKKIVVDYANLKVKEK